MLLRPQLALAKDLTWPLQGFAVDNTEYHDVGLGEWTGFYDWLRDSDGGLLGVRYWLNSGTEFLVSHTQTLPYVSRASNHIEIYFSERRVVDPKLSCDQAFLYDALFRSSHEEYAIAFGTEDLSRVDLEKLEETKAEWPQLRAVS